MLDNFLLQVEGPVWVCVCMYVCMCVCAHVCVHVCVVLGNGLGLGLGSLPKSPNSPPLVPHSPRRTSNHEQYNILLQLFWKLIVMVCLIILNLLY